MFQCFYFPVGGQVSEHTVEGTRNDSGRFLFQNVSLETISAVCEGAAFTTSPSPLHVSSVFIFVNLIGGDVFIIFIMYISLYC